MTIAVEKLPGTVAGTTGLTRTQTDKRKALGRVPGIACWVEGDTSLVNDFTVGAEHVYTAAGGPGVWTYFSQNTKETELITGTDSQKALRIGWDDVGDTAGRTQDFANFAGIASPAGAPILPTGSYSMFFVTSIEAAGVIFANRTDVAGDLFYVQCNGGQLRVYQNGALACFYSAVDVRDNVTRAWEVHYDSVTQTQTLYLNGALVDTATSVAPIPSASSVQREVGLGALTDSLGRGLSRGAFDMYALGIFDRNLSDASETANFATVMAYLDEKFPSLSLV